MARVYVLVLILFELSTGWTIPIAENSELLLKEDGDVSVRKIKDIIMQFQVPTEKSVEARPTETSQDIANTNPMTTGTAEPPKTTPDTKSTPEPLETTPKTMGTPELKVEVIVAPTPVITRVTLRERRCCRIGRKAARKGYSCYVDMAILERRLNMPHRYKMKFVAHGPKYGNGFANKLQFCGKDRKRRRIFNHCCDKDAAIMDF